MADIADRKARALEEIAEVKIAEDVPEEQYRDSFVEAAMDVLCTMVTQASMEWDEEEGEGAGDDYMHPMDVVDVENVQNVYVTDAPYRAPMVVLQVEECPTYAKLLTETREVWVRTKPALSSEKTWARFQVR
ncbi:hypothetical protein HUG10_21065 (plasmid) [Halorarum halophilum]|uniref:Uncharacterized protein n=1 Tax=Halorarum halophilum TaxID=2743090 RepID=A0A7D5KAS7_9EURY|nr:hypothetical protein [Halobaculum halophilum]QLG30079.1 hypothetical protein HUG10_21065 [Halobaculum halophilum]